MTSRRHRRLYFAGAFASAAVMLTGCAVPGQPGAPAEAAALPGIVVTNKDVEAHYDAWRYEFMEFVERRNVVTSELLRDKLIAQAEEDGLGYARSVSKLKLEAAMDYRTLRAEQDLRYPAPPAGPPSDALLDNYETMVLVAMYALDQTTFSANPEGLAVLQEIAIEIEDEATSSPRSGEFSAATFMSTVDALIPLAGQALQQQEPGWETNFRYINGFVSADTPWIASE